MGSLASGPGALSPLWSGVRAGAQPVRAPVGRCGRGRAYLDEEYERQRTALEAVRQAAPGPREALLSIFDLLVRNAANPRFRGCPFTNAAAEYPDPTHPVRRTIADYRRWNRGLFRDLLAKAGHPEPGGTATMLMMLRDGIVVGGGLDSPSALHPHAREAVTRIFDTASPR